MLRQFRTCTHRSRFTTAERLAGRRLLTWLKLSRKLTGMRDDPGIINSLPEPPVRFGMRVNGRSKTPLRAVRDGEASSGDARDKMGRSRPQREGFGGEAGGSGRSFAHETVTALYELGKVGRRT